MVDKPFDPDAFLAAKSFDPDEFLRGGTPSGAQQNPVTWPAAGSETSSYQTAKDLALIAGHEGTFGVWPRILGAADAATSDKTYGQAVDERFALENAAKERVGPFLSSTASAVGGLATGLPLVRSGATLLGRTAPWSLPRLGANIIEPGLYGAIHGVGGTHSENLPDYIRNASIGFGIGGALGAALPAAGAATKAIYQTAADRFAGIPTSLARAARADASGLASIATHGPEAMLLDAGPSMRSVAQGYVQGTGAPKSIIETALKSRDRATVPRLDRDTTAAVGTAETPSYIEEGIRGRMTAMSPAYDAVLSKAKAVDTEPLANHIEAQIINERGPAQAALRQVRQMLDIPTPPGFPPKPPVLDPHPAALQATREAVRGMRDDPNIDNNTKRALTDVYKRLTEEMHKKIPGIRELDSQYAELGSQERAIQPTSPGARIFQTAEPGVIRPNEMRDILAAAAMPKGVNIGPSAEAFRLRQAARAELDRRVGTHANDLNTLEATIGTPQDYNAQKMSIMFGQQPADDIARSLAANRLFREGYQKISQGSETAPRLAAAAENKPKEVKIAGSMWERLLERPFAFAVNKARTAADERVRAQIADVLTAQGAARDAQAARLLEHNARVIPRGEAYDKYVRRVAQSGLADLLNPFTGDR